MRIMFLVPMINSDEIDSYRKNKAGLAFTIRAIVEELAKFGHEISVYAQSGFSKGLVTGTIRYEKKKLVNIFPISFRYIWSFFRDTIGCKMSIKNRIHVLSHYLYGSYVERLLLKNRPDIVSIRGIGYYTKPLIDACEKTNIPYVVSLHGLISFLDENEVTIKEKEMERELFRRAIYEDKPMTVIASGIKKRMLKEFGREICNSIIVVNNGIDRKNAEVDYKEVELIRERYGIAKSDKVIISAAHITKRKNQVQILRAFSLLPEIFKQHTKLLFLGDGDQKEILENMVREYKLEKNVCLCGFVSNEHMGEYFSVADVNVISSLDEGFGRAFVEAFLYGVPTVTFSDLDAVQDLYDEEAMVCVSERTDEALAEGIKEALEREWNERIILEHGKHFSVENMAKKYEEVYRNCLEQK